MLRFLAASLLLGATAFADSKSSTPPLSKQTRLELVRAISAEFAFTRKQLPLGEKVITIRSNGKLATSDREILNLVANRGQVARAGDRIQITALEFKKDAIIFEINGGPKKKKPWYKRLEVGVNNRSTPIDTRPDPDARGLSIVVEYDKHVPEMTAADLRERLNPLFDFTVKSAAQAYTETLPKNVQDAIKDRRVLVGMTKEMVTYAKGRPPKRLREKDENQNDYEEWIFGEPPQDVEFVRFNGDEVVQLKIMKVDGEKIVRTEKEVHMPVPGAGMEVAAEPQPQGQTPGASSQAPTLRRPGEAPPGLQGEATSSRPAAKPTGPRPPPTPAGDPDAPRLLLGTSVHLH
ncbi:MAG: hypothetical protein ABIP81_08230 [Terriglobales bacterium]